jgi:flagellar hook-associated protein 2
MATVSSLGIGSGIDLAGMLSSIMTNERAPITALDTKISSYNTQISLFGTIKSNLSTLQTAAETLEFPSRLGAVSATPNDTTVLSATATASAPKGNYTVNVTQLASVQKSFTSAYVSGKTFSAGTLSFTFAGDTTSHNVAISAGDTLAQISAKINSAGIGISASVISGVDGQRLMLAGANSGSTNGFTLAVGTTGLAEDATKKIVAADALITVDGVDLSSATNTFATQIPELTLTAQKLGTTTVNVQTDNSKVVTAVQAFVDAYNATVTEVKKDTAYDSTNKTAQPLNGDTAARSILSTLTSARITTPSSLSTSTVKSLASLGVTVQQNGQLSLDTTKLTKALNTAPTDAMAAVNAFGKSFSDVITGLLASGSTIENRVTGLTTQIKRAQASQTAMEARVAILQAQYQKQFASLDTLVSQYKSTSSYLTQRFSTSSSSSG